MTKALQEPTQPVRLGFQILLGLANAGAIMALLPVLNILIPSQVTMIDLEHSAINLAFVLTLGALVGNPLAGALSDRTTSRFGRRPWILGGMLATAVGLAILANSHMVLLAITWCTVQFFGNVLLASYSAIVPDRVPVHQRGTTQAIIGFASPTGIILGAFCFGQVQDFRAGYYVTIGVLVILTAIFLWSYREPQFPKGLLPAFRPGPFLASFWINPVLSANILNNPPVDGQTH